MNLSTEKSTKTTVATINNQKIVIVLNGKQKFVPVRPICEALGVDYSSQVKRLKRDQILNSVVVTMTTTGADKKQYEMIVLPLRYVFGWLLTIDANSVREDVRPAVIRYQKECYDVLFDHFSRHADYVDFRQDLIEQALAKQAAIRKVFNKSRVMLKEAKNELEGVLEYTFDDYTEGIVPQILIPKELEEAQTSMEFPTATREDAFV